MAEGTGEVKKKKKRTRLSPRERRFKRLEKVQKEIARQEKIREEARKKRELEELQSTDTESTNTDSTSDSTSDPDSIKKKFYSDLFEGIKDGMESSREYYQNSIESIKNTRASSSRSDALYDLIKPKEEGESLNVDEPSSNFESTFIRELVEPLLKSNKKIIEQLSGIKDLLRKDKENSRYDKTPASESSSESPSSVEKKEEESVSKTLKSPLESIIESVKNIRNIPAEMISMVKNLGPGIVTILGVSFATVLGAKVGEAIREAMKTTDIGSSILDSIGETIHDAARAVGIDETYQSDVIRDKEKAERVKRDRPHIGSFGGDAQDAVNRAQLGQKESRAIEDVVTDKNTQKAVKRMLSNPHMEYIEKYSKMYGVDKNTMLAIAEAETASGRNKNKSSTGASGMMQIQPAYTDSKGKWHEGTAIGLARKLGVTEQQVLNDPETNVRASVLLQKLNTMELERASKKDGVNRVTPANLAGVYNAGHAAIRKYGYSPDNFPVAETKNNTSLYEQTGPYMRSVQRNKDALDLAEGRIKEQSGKVPEAQKEASKDTGKFVVDKPALALGVPPMPTGINNFNLKESEKLELYKHKDNKESILYQKDSDKTNETNSEKKDTETFKVNPPTPPTPPTAENGQTPLVDRLTGINSVDKILDTVKHSIYSHERTLSEEEKQLILKQRVIDKERFYSGIPHDQREDVVKQNPSTPVSGTTGINNVLEKSKSFTREMIDSVESKMEVTERKDLSSSMKSYSSENSTDHSSIEKQEKNNSSSSAINSTSNTTTSNTTTSSKETYPFVKTNEVLQKYSDIIQKDKELWKVMDAQKLDEQKIRIGALLHKEGDKSPSSYVVKNEEGQKVVRDLKEIGKETLLTDFIKENKNTKFSIERSNKLDKEMKSDAIKEIERAAKESGTTVDNINNLMREAPASAGIPDFKDLKADSNLGILTKALEEKTKEETKRLAQPIVVQPTPVTVNTPSVSSSGGSSQVERPLTIYDPSSAIVNAVKDLIKVQLS